MTGRDPRPESVERYIVRQARRLDEIARRVAADAESRRRLFAEVERVELYLIRRDKP